MSTWKVELDQSNYLTKADLNKANSFDTSKFAKKTDLASLKSDIDRLHIERLKADSGDVSKLSNVANNEIVKKTHKLVTKVNIIIPVNLFWKLNIKLIKVGPENEIPDTSGLVEKTDYNTIIIEIEVNIPNTTGLATTAAFDAVGNKIPNVNNLVKKGTFYDPKTSDIEQKYFSTSDYNKFTNKIINWWKDKMKWIS